MTRELDRRLTLSTQRYKPLKEGVDCLLAGDVAASKIVLRDYINATMGFEELGTLTNKPPRA